MFDVTIWMFPKIWENPQIIHFNRVFHYFHHPFWGYNTPIFGSTPIYAKPCQSCAKGHAGLVQTWPTLNNHRWGPKIRGVFSLKFIIGKVGFFGIPIFLWGSLSLCILKHTKKTQSSGIIFFQVRCVFVVSFFLAML